MTNDIIRGFSASIAFVAAGIVWREVRKDA